MASVQVIVQNIPINTEDPNHSLHEADKCSYPGYCTDKEKHFIEQLFNKYGPSECSYLWSNEIGFLRLGKLSYDNFAHVTFQNVTDAMRACEAAKNHEIKVNDDVLILTIESDDDSIAKLDDDCLVEIFSMLDLDSKLAVEHVCRRWKEVASRSWTTVKTLNLNSSLPYNIWKFEKYLMNCGTYLNAITVDVKSVHIMRLIRTYCKKLRTLVLKSIPLEQIYIDELSDLLKVLPELKSFTFVERVPPSQPNSFIIYMKATSDMEMWVSNQFNTLKNLPESLEEFSLTLSNIAVVLQPSLNLAKFHNLRSLTLSHLTISECDVKAIVNLKNLVHLNLEQCPIPDRFVKKIQNFTNLKTLKIAHIGATDDVILNIVMNNRDLECLDLSGNESLSDQSLLEISMLPHLKDLRIDSCSQITLNLIDEMPLLEKLICTDCPKVNDEAVGRLIQLAPNLRYLNVQWCSITIRFPEIADYAVRKRGSEVSLKITATFPVNSYVPCLGLSPLLEFEYIRDFELEPPFSLCTADNYHFDLMVKKAMKRNTYM